MTNVGVARRPPYWRPTLFCWPRPSKPYYPAFKPVLSGLQSSVWVMGIHPIVAPKVPLTFSASFTAPNRSGRCLRKVTEPQRILLSAIFINIIYKLNYLSYATVRLSDILYVYILFCLSLPLSLTVSSVD